MYWDLQNDLDDEAFENYKSALLVKLLAKDLTLVAESDRLWTLIVEERCFFIYNGKLYLKLSVIIDKAFLRCYNFQVQI
jgi:nardilysin